MKASWRDTIHHGKKFDLRFLDLETASGSESIEAVDHPGGVVIVPFVSDEEVVLVRNVRPVVGETLLEFPAGTVDHPESPQTCAARELEEETGYRAGSLQWLGEFYSAPGFCNELLHIFIARDLTWIGQQLEATEELSPEIHPLALFKDITGSLRDAKTLAALFLLLQQGMME